MGVKGGWGGGGKKRIHRDGVGGWWWWGSGWWGGGGGGVYTDPGCARDYCGKLFRVKECSFSCVVIPG